MFPVWFVTCWFWSTSGTRHTSSGQEERRALAWTVQPTQFLRKYVGLTSAIMAHIYVGAHESAAAAVIRRSCVYGGSHPDVVRAFY